MRTGISQNFPSTKFDSVINEFKNIVYFKRVSLLLEIFFRALYLKHFFKSKFVLSIILFSYGFVFLYTILYLYVLINNYLLKKTLCGHIFRSFLNAYILYTIWLYTY